jgi:phosphatidate cytidylyltransferase
MSRIITGLILIGIGWYVLTNGGLPLMVFLTLIGVVAFYEIQQMTPLSSPWLTGGNMLVYVGGMGYLYRSGALLSVGYVAITLILFSIFLYEFSTKTLVFQSRPLLNNLKYFGYVSIGFSAIYLIRMSEQGVLYIGILFLSIWATDIFAYYGGRALGQRPLSPISPKKTIEGTVIGVASAAVMMGGVAWGYGLSWWVVVLAVGIGLMGQLGDLYESLIKRTYNVKDSSNLLPGHGGVLDRADSSLFVAPLLYVVIILLL